jgi:hypothetical protein
MTDRTENVNLRVTPAQKTWIKGQAEGRGQTMTDFLLELIRAGAKTSGAGQQSPTLAEKGTRSPEKSEHSKPAAADLVPPEITFIERVTQLRSQGKTSVLAMRIAREEGLRPDP